MSLPQGTERDAFSRYAEEVARDPSRGVLCIDVASRWTGGLRSSTRWKRGGTVLTTGGPAALDGDADAPNPQELLFAAINASLILGLSAHAAARGIVLDDIAVSTRGSIDLRAFLGIAPWVPRGGTVTVQVDVRSRESEARVREALDAALARSSVLATLGDGVGLDVALDVRPPEGPSPPAA